MDRNPASSGGFVNREHWIMTPTRPLSLRSDAAFDGPALESMLDDIVRAVSDRVPFGSLPSPDEMRATARLGAELAVAQRGGEVDRAAIARAARSEVEAALWCLGGVLVGPCC